ncbi:SIMPL domain-containing protein [Pseudomonas sp. HR96]|uniref:SIMPL domain-containing protein n=1 Tax=Pseudomonas sp. HR96 TaxID=1027966 RepID=UPI002A765DF7|nr:SIMPL domain-containing protein [Pseudomonas sp. HR96]WPO99247.1 SIMPL domain-containing protein [Pseudomonas sp. HR96]
MPRLSRSAAVLLAAGALASLPALADDARYNQISLRAEVSQEVPRDLMMVTLYTEAQDADPARLAAQISDSVNKALAQARQVQGVTLRQGARNSYPVYDDKGQKITGWRERAEIRLESPDFPALSRLTGDLLQNLKMGSMDFAISPNSRKVNEDALLKEAVGAFKGSAALATEAMGGKSYKVVNLNLNTSGFNPTFARAPVMMMKAARDAAPVTPDVEAGTSQVSITAEGTIEVVMP